MREDVDQFPAWATISPGSAGISHLCSGWHLIASRTALETVRGLLSSFSGLVNPRLALVNRAASPQSSSATP
jgi:hypothetical protein